MTDFTFVKDFALEFALTSAPDQWNQQLLIYFNALRAADAHGFSAIRMLKHRREAINTTCSDIANASQKFLGIPDDIRHAALVAAYAEDFVASPSRVAQDTDYWHDR